MKTTLHALALVTLVAGAAIPSSARAMPRDIRETEARAEANRWLVKPANRAVGDALLEWNQAHPELATKLMEWGSDHCEEFYKWFEAARRSDGAGDAYLKAHPTDAALADLTKSDEAGARAFGAFGRRFAGRLGPLGSCSGSGSDKLFLLDSAVDYLQDRRVRDKLIQARKLATANDYAGASALFDELIKSHRLSLVETPAIVAELAWVQLLAGRLDEAETNVRAAMNPSPGSSALTKPAERASALYTLGRIQEKRGQKDLAIESYQKSLELRPNHRDVMSHLSALKSGAPAPAPNSK